MNASEAVWTNLWEQARAIGPDPDLADLSDEQVEEQVRSGAARIAALTCQWLVHVTELVVRGIWAEDGQSTPGVWLSWRVGVAPATAREYVRVGLALRTAPKIRDRFAAGTLSYSKVRAITRVAAPQTEDMLLDLADAAPAGALERIIAGCRHQLADRERWADDPPTPGDVDPRDFQRLERDPDTVEYRVRVSAADAAAFDARIDRLVDLADRADHQPTLQAVADPTDEEDDEPVHVPIAARRAQALCDALATAVASGPPDRSGDDDHLVVLHVDAAELAAAVRADQAEDAGGSVSAEATPERRRRVVTGRGRSTSLAPSAITRLACTADLRLAGIDDADDPRGHPADIGRRSRRVPPDLRRALVLRDRHCRFPGCHRTHRLHAHHVWHWALGGPTDLDNLLLVCSFHHRFVHDAHWQLHAVDPINGRWTFHPPGGATPRHPAPPLDGASAETASQVLDDPHPRSLEPPWFDGPYDLSLTIGVLTDALDDLQPAISPNLPDRGPHPWLRAA